MRERSGSTSALPTTLRWTDRFFQRFIGPAPGGPKSAALIVAALIVSVGFFDWATGDRISLVVFYLMPIVLIVIWLGRTAGVIASVGSVVVRFVADALDNHEALRATWLWWNSAGSFVVYLIMVWVLDALLTLQRQLEARVSERTADLEEEVRKRQEVQRQLLELSARERSSMGRELHDQLGQHLVATAMAAQVLAQRVGARDEAAAREARHIASMVEQGIAETRQLARGLLLTTLEPARIASEIEELCSNLRQRYPDTRLRCEIGNLPVLPEAPVAAQIFRIAQEALRNALRHSGAKEVSLHFEGTDALIALAVEDDGRGVASDAEVSSGLGLGIMRHRADHIGADFGISARTGGGTRVTCIVPLSRPLSS